MKIGIIREGKIPMDKRVALTPAQCQEVVDKFPFVEIMVQKSPFRCYKDSEYEALGFPLVNDVEDCDILLGIKEVPINDLMHFKTYFFFSHTIKKQSYNRNLLIELLNKKIRMIDYETLVSSNGQRVIAFGRFAGLVGSYNGIMAYGKRNELFDLKPAHECFDLAEMKSQFEKVKLPPIKIVVTGGGRVAKGAMETLDGMKIKKVSPSEFLGQNTFEEAVYTQLEPEDYHKHKEGNNFELQDFFDHPANFLSSFDQFWKSADLLIAAAYWHPESPVLFTRADMQRDDFRIKVIADITCDIEGSIPSTKRASTIDDPLYDYNPDSENVEPALSSKKNFTVMAVDNLPNELPRDASESFGRQMIDNVLPNLLIEDTEGMIEKAMITIDGKLTKRYSYLQDFVDGKE